MRVLWLCNVVIPKVAEMENLPYVPTAGWIESLFELLVTQSDIELTLCMPYSQADEVRYRNTECFSYLLFYGEYSIGRLYCNQTVSIFADVLSAVKPDIVHIFGTEYPHTLAMIKACEFLGFIDRVIVDIQGLTGIYAQHYFEGMPCETRNGHAEVENRWTGSSMLSHQIDFARNGELEVAALRKVKHVTGRTEWDFICSMQINPNVTYHKCDRVLRESFYAHEAWYREGCVTHSIFISQGGYPVKGLHYAIDALGMLTEEFADVHLYVAGRKLLDDGKWIPTPYAQFIRTLVAKHRLGTHITFTGLLSESQMCERLTNSHVSVIPSSIENSCNALAEAGILGVPRVASYVGGMPDQVRHGVDGFLYQHSAPYMLAGFIKRLFNCDDLAKSFSKESIKSAHRKHDMEKIKKTILDIYETVDRLQK